MTEPATDEEIEQIEAYALECGGLDDVLSLIARIRSEQEARKVAEERVLREMHREIAMHHKVSSIREKTIRECAAIIKKRRDEIWRAQDGKDHGVDTNLRLMAIPLDGVEDTVLALLEASK